MIEASDETGDSSSLNQSEKNLSLTIEPERRMVIELEHRSKLRKLIQPETLKALLPILLDIGVVRAKQVWTLMNHQNEELKVKELENILQQLRPEEIKKSTELEQILQLCIPQTSSIQRAKMNVMFTTSSSSDDERDRDKRVVVAAAEL